MSRWQTLLIFALLFFRSSFTYGANTRIVGSKELPLELNLMLESLQSSVSEDSYQELRTEALDSIMRIDRYARALNKEDIFLIAKIEIYKSLLKTNVSFPKASVDGDTLKTLKESLKLSNDAFVTWFLKALLKDTENLLESASFKDYLLQKNTGKLEQLNYKKIDKKVQIIYRWVSKINLSSTDALGSFKAELEPVLIDALRNIEQSFFILAQTTSFNPLPAPVTSGSELKFFTLKKPAKKVAKEVKKEKTIDDILEPVTAPEKTSEVVLPEPSKENWLNEESTPLNLKNLPKPSDDADWLQDF